MVKTSQFRHVGLSKKGGGNEGDRASRGQYMEDIAKHDGGIDRWQFHLGHHITSFLCKAVRLTSFYYHPSYVQFHSFYLQNSPHLTIINYHLYPISNKQTIILKPCPLLVPPKPPPPEEPQLLARPPPASKIPTRPWPQGLGGRRCRSRAPPLQGSSSRLSQT